MTLRAFTTNPSQLMQLIAKKIEKEEITTWTFHERAGGPNRMRYKAAQWREHGYFDLRIHEGDYPRLEFQFHWLSAPTADRIPYSWASFHGDLLQMLTVHCRQIIKDIRVQPDIDLPD